MTKLKEMFRVFWQRFKHKPLLSLPEVKSALRWAKSMEKDFVEFGIAKEEVVAMRTDVYLVTTATIVTGLLNRHRLISSTEEYLKLKAVLLRMSKGSMTEEDERYKLITNGTIMTTTPFISVVYILHALSIVDLAKCSIWDLTSFMDTIAELDGLYIDNVLYVSDVSYKQNLNPETARLVAGDLKNRFVSELKDMVEAHEEQRALLELENL